MKFVCDIYLDYNFFQIMLGLLFDDDDGIMFCIHNNLDFLIWEVNVTVRGRVCTMQWTNFVFYLLAGPS